MLLSSREFMPESRRVKMCTSQYTEVKMSQSTTMTVRLEPEIKSRLEKLSAATHRSKSFLAAEAVREFIEVNEWQIEDIKKATKEADADDFASDREVWAVFHRWGVDGD